MGRRSSGSCITTELRMYMALRILAGASYLDMIWYQVDIDHVHEYTWEVIVAINEVEDNIQLPADEEGWKDLANQFDWHPNHLLHSIYHQSTPNNFL